MTMKSKHTVLQLLLFTAFIWAIPASAQNKHQHPSTRQDTVLPQPGYDFLSYLANKIRITDTADAATWSSRCVVRFRINSKGYPEHITVMRHVSPAYDKEITRVIKTMPPWRSGTINGKPAALDHTMPISLHIE